MLTPVEIEFRQLPPSAAVSAGIRKRCRALDALWPDLLGCEVWLKPIARGAEPDFVYEAGLRLRLPGRTITTSLHAHSLLAAVHAAFDSAQRQLESDVHARRGCDGRGRHLLPGFQPWRGAIAEALS